LTFDQPNNFLINLPELNFQCGLSEISSRPTLLSIWKPERPVEEIHPGDIVRFDAMKSIGTVLLLQLQ